MPMINTANMENKKINTKDARKIRAQKKLKIKYDIARKADYDGSCKDFLKLSTECLNSAKSYSVQRHVETYANGALLIGIELEIESKPDKQTETVKLINSIMPDVRCVRDGSLGRYSGVEINTLPHNAEEFNANRVLWHKLLNALNLKGCNSHNATTCGLHVHVNRKYLPYESWRKIEAFIIRNKAAFIKLSRRKDTCLNCCKFKYSGELGRLYPADDAYSTNVDSRISSDRYHAVNITGHTVEFRFFRGTLLPQSFIGSIESIILLCKYFKEENPKRVGFKTFSKWLLFQEKHPFGRILLQSIVPEAVPTRRVLTSEEREQRKVIRLQNASARKGALEHEIQQLIGTNSINNLWVHKDMRYNIRDNSLPVELITVPVTFIGKLKKSIKKSNTHITLNVIKPAGALAPTSLVVYKAVGWGSTRISRHAVVDHNNNNNYTSRYQYFSINSSY